MRRPLVLALFLAAGPAAAHSFYDDWLIPGTEQDCCHEQDCGPTEFCTLPAGGEAPGAGPGGRREKNVIR